MQQGKRLRVDYSGPGVGGDGHLFALGTPATVGGAGTATLRGTVTDTSGGVLPGATVTVTNTGTKAARTAVTDDRGGYVFAGLFPGTYELKVELQGFKTYEPRTSR